MEVLALLPAAMADTALTPTVLQALRPADVVHHRDQMLRWWSISGHAQRLTALQGRTPLPGWENYDVSGEVGRLWMMAAFRDAQLYWVSPEMTAVIETLAASIPDCYPQPLVPNGFVMFAKSVVGTDAANGKPIFTTAILWDHNTLATAGDCIALETYAWRDLVTDYVEMSEEDKVVFRSHFPCRLFATGGSEWPVGELTTQFTRLPADDATKQVSIIEDRQLMATFWALCSQKITVESIQAPTRAMRREAQRAGRGEPPSVRVIRLREPTTRTETDAGREVEWSHRWVTSAHWRNQWYPSTGQHRPIPIEAYIKGPADKPLKVRETVRALVR